MDGYEKHVLDARPDDPAGFNEFVLGQESVAKQIEVCLARSPASPVTVVPAGRGARARAISSRGSSSGGSTPARKPVITTGPDHRQVVSVSLEGDSARHPAVEYPSRGRTHKSRVSPRIMTYLPKDMARPSDSSSRGDRMGSPGFRREQRGRIQRPARGGSDGHC